MLFAIPYWQTPDINDLADKPITTLLVIALIVLVLVLLFRERSNGEQDSIGTSLVDFASKESDARLKADERAEKREELNRQALTEQIKTMAEQTKLLASIRETVASTPAAMEPKFVHIEESMTEKADKNYKAIGAATEELKQLHTAFDKFIEGLPPLIKSEITPLVDRLNTLTEKAQTSQNAVEAALKTSTDTVNEEIRKLKESIVELANKLNDKPVATPATNTLTVTVAPATPEVPPLPNSPTGNEVKP